MAFDAYIKIDGIPGESTDSKHKDWIEILSFSQGITQPPSATRSSAGGASTGRAMFADFLVTKLVDKASPLLYQACASGKHIKEVTVEMCRAGGDHVKFMEIKMEEVLVSSVSPAGGHGDKEADEFPLDKLTLNFGKIKWTYTQQKREDGSGGGNTTGNWDLKANKVS